MSVGPQLITHRSRSGISPTGRKDRGRRRRVLTGASRIDPCMGAALTVRRTHHKPIAAGAHYKIAPPHKSLPRPTIYRQKSARLDFCQ